MIIQIVFGCSCSELDELARPEVILVSEDNLFEGSLEEDGLVEEERASGGQSDELKVELHWA